MRLQIPLFLLGLLALLAALWVSVLMMSGLRPGRDYVVRLALPEAGQPVDLPRVYGPSNRARPLVVIDAGHGGKDPGASVEGYREKDIALGLALALRDQLVGEGGIRVALTREDDRFLVLEERPEIARRMGADLFVSIHADAEGDGSEASGASIYTLSSTASSEAAARFAERENNADRLNGVRIAGQSEQVSAILVELSQRRVQEESMEFADLILREGEGVLVFHPRPRRSAALAVLRAPDVPAVLYESGFITNPEDARRLAAPEGRERFANVMARAIRVYFARQAGI